MKKNRCFPAVWRTVLSAGMCCVAVFLLCGPLPTDIGKNNFPIELALDDGTKTTATFSGEPITAFITLPDSVHFDTIAWHLGSGQYYYPDISPLKKIKQAQVKLYWTYNPLNKDTAKKQWYDTVYVSITGETFRSNKVIVYVTNIPPSFDSVRVGSTLYRNEDTIRYVCSMNDTATHLVLRANTHDFNADLMHYLWHSSRGVSLQNVSSVLYTLPAGEFVDTVTVTVYDGKGGSETKTIILTKLPPNASPVVDSIKVGLRVFAQDTTFHVYSVRQLDTVRFVLYSHDPDAGDVMTATWKNTNAKNSFVRTSVASFSASLVCDSSYRRTFDSLRTVDTVTVSIKDRRGDSAKTIIRIMQGTINNAPRLDSIRVNALMQCKGTTTMFRDSASGKDTFMLRVFASDPDSGDSVKLSVQSKKAMLLQKLTDTTILYICKDSLSTDTIVCVVKDIRGDSAKKYVVVKVVNRFPVIDSISVHGIADTFTTVYKGPDPAYERLDSAFAKDTITIRLFARDPDAGDTIAIRWMAAGGQVLKKSDTKGLVVTYYTDTTAYDDTIRVQVLDKKQKSMEKSVILHVKKLRRPVHTPPRIDSIRVNTLMQCKGTVLLARDSASGRDTMLLRIFASDPDAADSVKLSVTAKQTSLLTRLSDTTVRYACKDSLYTDTITCAAKDNNGDSAKKSVIITIVNRLPVVDSITIADSVAKRTTTITLSDSLIIGTESIAARDSVRLRLFAHDPDPAPKDSIAHVQWTITSGKTMKLLDVKGLFVQYPCQDSTYTDTVSVKILDTKQKWARASLIFEVTK
jgi:hypothetical protein